MQILRDFIVMYNLNRLINDGEITFPVKNQKSFFDVECQSFSIKSSTYDISLKVAKETSSICPESFTLSFRDPNHKLLDGEKLSNGRLIENNTALARMIFHRLEKYYKKCK